MGSKDTCSSSKFILKSSGDNLHIEGATTACLGHKIASGNSLRQEGVWAEWKWHDGQFELTNDRYGFYPLFYYTRNGDFGVSSNIMDLLRSGASTKLDDAAMAVFLRSGSFIGNDTPFESIRAVPPDSRLSWCNGQLEVCTNSDSIARSESAMSRKEAVRAFGDLFQDAMGRMLPTENDRVALPLSGGRDSRHILFALSRAGHLPDVCITTKSINPKGNEDAHFASIVARELGIRHVVVEASQSRVSYETRKNALTSLCANEGAWLLPLADYIRKEKYDLLYDGIAGGPLSAGHFLTRQRLELYDSGRLDLLAEELLGQEQRWRLMLPKDIYKRWNRELAASHLVEELAKYTQSPNPVGQFFFWNRTRRLLALDTWGMLAQPARVLAPFLAHDVFDFLSQLPASYLLEFNAFHTEAIAAFYPEYAHIPYEDKEAPVTKMTRNRRTDLLNLLKETYLFLISEKGNVSYLRRSFLGQMPILLCLSDIGLRPHWMLWLLTWPTYLIQLQQNIAEINL